MSPGRIYTHRVKNVLNYDLLNMITFPNSLSLLLSNFKRVDRMETRVRVDESRKPRRLLSVNSWMMRHDTREMNILASTN